MVEKYLGLCPKSYHKKPNFYLQSLRSPTPKQWYGREVMGANKIKEVVKDLLSSAEIDGYFTNHSLRRSGGTRLFQAGVDRKLVKEVTGHRSDAVDCYQITSEEQREKLSTIIACNVEENIEKSSNNVEKNVDKTREITKIDSESCTCKCLKHSNYKTNIGEIVNEMVERNLKTGKTVIKLEIHIQNE